MTIEQISKLSEATEMASMTNDIETLTKIYKIIRDDITENGGNEEGGEWFLVLIRADQFEAINSRI
jgi:hypothetical protein